MPSPAKSGFAEFVFSSRPVHIDAYPTRQRVDFVKPAVVGFSEEEFTLVMVETGSGAPSYVGITRNGGYVPLSSSSGERQLLKRAEAPMPKIEPEKLYLEALAAKYARKKVQIRLLSILIFMAIVVAVSGLYVIWPVVRDALAFGPVYLNSFLGAVVCAILIALSLRVLQQSIRLILLD